MKIVEIKNLDMLKELKVMKGEEFIVDFENCKNNDKIKIIYFLSGLTFINGSLKKIASGKFEIRISI